MLICSQTSVMGVSRMRSGPYFWRSPFVTCNLLNEQFCYNEPRCDRSVIIILNTTHRTIVMWCIWKFEYWKASTLYAPWYCPTCTRIENQMSEGVLDCQDVCTTYVVYLNDILINHAIDVNRSIYQSHSLHMTHEWLWYNDYIYWPCNQWTLINNSEYKIGSIKAPPLPSRKLVGHAPTLHPKLSWEHPSRSSTKAFAGIGHSIFANQLEQLKLHPNTFKMQLHEHLEDVQRFTSVAAAKPRDSLETVMWFMEGALSTPLAWICGNNNCWEE